MWKQYCLLFTVSVYGCYGEYRISLFTNPVSKERNYERIFVKNEFLFGLKIFTDWFFVRTVRIEYWKKNIFRIKFDKCAMREMPLFSDTFNPDEKCTNKCVTNLNARLKTKPQVIDIWMLLRATEPKGKVCAGRKGTLGFDCNKRYLNTNFGT